MTRSESRRRCARLRGFSEFCLPVTVAKIRLVSRYICSPGPGSGCLLQVLQTVFYLPLSVSSALAESERQQPEGKMTVSVHEKAGIQCHVTAIHDSPTDSELSVDGAWAYLNNHRDASQDEVDLDALRRKIDKRILPLLLIAYTLQFLDKVVYNVSQHCLRGRAITLISVLTAAVRWCNDSSTRS